MKTLFQIKSLLTTLENSKGMSELEAVLNDYETALDAAVAGNAEYRPKLRRLIEEIPDLRRMIPKKFDAILKGRIQDGLRAFRKQVEEMEAPGAEAPGAEALADAAENATPSDPSHAVTEVKLGDEEPQQKPFRNMPSLGMD